MMPLLVVLLLVASLLVVEQHTRSHALSPTCPLDDDRDLPLPWAGHASTVFSLTALFGAYVGVFLLLGPVALAGVAAGGVGALVFVRRVISRSSAESFDAFLGSRRFATDKATNESLWLLLVGTQLAYATSEVVILRELGLQVFGLTPRHATGYALSVALVAYLYCLRGGYRGVFRTDVLQLVFTVLMCIAFSGIPVQRLFSGEPLHYQPQLHLWAPAWASSPLAVVFSFIFGLAMGAAFLLASPDAWKRVYVSGAGDRRAGFWVLVAAGATPFLLLVPALLSVPPIDLLAPDPSKVISALIPTPWLLVALTLGMTASFLSSFDSALITAVHALMVRTPHASRLADYHYRLGGAFLAIIFLFLGLVAWLRNPYFIGILLIGPYALLGGTFLGTCGLARPMRAPLLWPLLLLVVVWLVFSAQQPDIIERPIPSHAHLVPYGVGVFGAVVVGAFLASRWKKQ